MTHHFYVVHRTDIDDLLFWADNALLGDVVEAGTARSHGHVAHGPTFPFLYNSRNRELHNIGPIRDQHNEPPPTQNNVLIVQKGVPSMSEQENIETAKKQIAALNARNLDEYMSRVDESFVGESDSPLSPIRGREGARKALEMTLAAFPDFRLEIEQILASGDFVVARVGVTGTHKGNYLGISATNKRVNYHSCNVVELRNGKAIRSRLYADNATLFQQLGVLSLPKAAAAG